AHSRTRWLRPRCKTMQFFALSITLAVALCHRCWFIRFITQPWNVVKIHQAVSNQHDIGEGRMRMSTTRPARTSLVVVALGLLSIATAFAQPKRPPASDEERYREHRRLTEEGERASR